MDGGCGPLIWDCFVCVLGCEQVKGVDDIPVFPVSLFFRFLFFRDSITLQRTGFSSSVCCIWIVP